MIVPVPVYCSPNLKIVWFSIDRDIMQEYHKQGRGNCRIITGDSQ